MSDTDLEASVSLSGESAGVVQPEVEHIELDDGQTQLVRLTFNRGALDVHLDFPIDKAEAFIVEYRDELIRAKQARMEWKTDTDPETEAHEENVEL